MSFIQFLVNLFTPRRPPRTKWEPPERSRGQGLGPAKTAWTPAPAPTPVSTSPMPPTTITGRCYVIDGDTIVINKVHIRLTGIDAPELEDPYGRIAKKALMDLCSKQVITAKTDGNSTYDRLVALCTLPDGTDLSGEMVKLGLALDWAKFSGGRYRHLEVEGVRRKLWRVAAKHQGRMPASIMSD